MSDEEKNSGTILVVDDNPMNLKLLLDFLHEADFRLLVAQDGASAIERASRARPDIILLDIMMAGLDGFETCGILKQRDDTREIPVIFITALNNTADKIKAFEMGGIDYITKPFQQEEVLARLTVHLKLKNLQRQLEEKNAMLDEKNRILDEKNDILRSLNATKDRFFSIIAHDLKNPIISFISGTNILQKQRSSEEEKKEVSRILHQNALRLNKLLEDLLKWAELQMKEMKLNPEDIELKELIDSLEIMVKDQMDKKNISFTSSLGPDLSLHADPNAIETVLRNLISNAIKYTHEGGDIWIDTREHDDYLEITVSDNGKGMDKRTLERLFKIETKFSTEGTAGEQGTGLGLILCQDLVTRMGGNIRVSSEPGKGSTFTVNLPQD